MNELRKKVMEIIKAVVRVYEDRIKTARDEQKGIDILGVNAECMEEAAKLDGYLSDFQERNKGKTQKKGFLGL